MDLYLVKGGNDMKVKVFYISLILIISLVIITNHVNAFSLIPKIGMNYSRYYGNNYWFENDDPNINHTGRIGGLGGLALELSFLEKKVTKLGFEFDVFYSLKGSRCTEDTYKELTILEFFNIILYLTRTIP